MSGLGDFFTGAAQGFNQNVAPYLMKKAWDSKEKRDTAKEFNTAYSEYKRTGKIPANIDPDMITKFASAVNLDRKVNQPMNDLSALNLELSGATREPDGTIKTFYKPKGAGKAPEDPYIEQSKIEKAKADLLGGVDDVGRPIVGALQPSIDAFVNEQSSKLPTTWQPGLMPWNWLNRGADPNQVSRLKDLTKEMFNRQIQNKLPTNHPQVSDVVAGLPDNDPIKNALLNQAPQQAEPALAKATTQAGQQPNPDAIALRIHQLRRSGVPVQTISSYLKEVNQNPADYANHLR